MSHRSERTLAAFALVAACSCGSTEAGEGGGEQTSATTSDATTSDESTGETGEEPEPGPQWLATWAAAPTEATPITAEAFAIDDQSLRQVAHVSLGGSEIRVRLANTFGESELPVAEAHLALSAEGSAIEPASDRVLTVGGEPSFSIPAGELIVTDPVALEVPALGDLSVSLYFAEGVMTTTVHAEANQTAWLSAGNLSAASSWSAMETTTETSSYWLSGIDVMAPADAATIVALGDSITDGSGSTLDANRRWPDRLAERLQANAATEKVAVVNAGIGGNCLLRSFVGPPALDRFERDVLDQPGVAWVIITEGINDIGVGSIFNQPVTADQLTEGYLELIEQAHERGLLVYGGTLLPYEGASYFTDEGEEVRQAINDWIRTSGSYDAVIDFDAVTRDPAAPARLLAPYDSGDHLHPSDAGYAAMADAIELALFE